MTKNKNKKKTVLITGSSQGIGLSIAKLLSEKNYDVFITGRDKSKLKKISSLLKIKNYFPADLTKEENINALINSIYNITPTIDILINNAGDYTYSPIEKTTNKDIEKIINLNTIAPYKLIQKTVEKMKKQNWGRIINIGSISGSVGEANASLYSMTKASIIGLSTALALELAENKITVNTINPGWVDTTLIDNEELKDEFSKQEIIEMIPQRRFVHPNEIANLCLYLISEEAKGLTGQSINLCAGLSLG